MAKNKEEKQKNSGLHTSAVGRVSYPSVIEPKYDELAKADVYEVTLMFPKNGKEIDTVLTAIKKAETLTTLDTTNPEWKSPIVDGDSKADSNPELAGHWSVKFKSKAEYKPRVVGLLKDKDGKLLEITDPAEIYGGCYGRVAFTAFCYKSGKNVGTSLSLSMFQKIKEGEPFGGSVPEKAFADSDQFLEADGDLM